MLHAARAFQYLGHPSQRRDRAEALGGLGVSQGGARSIGVDTGEILIIAKAGFKSAVLRFVGGVVGTADTVVDVLAELGVG